MVTMGIFLFKEKSPCQNRESNPGPQISSQKLWPLDHEAGLLNKCRNVIFNTYLVSLRNRLTSDTGKFGYIDVD
jgi:hypothetical protein